MPVIEAVRPVLLSAPYADTETNAEVLLHLPGGYRTCGMVEITLDNGIVGLGEGYIAVFAPKVFEQLIYLLRPYLIGRDVSESEQLYQELLTVIGYWSQQGAAMHAVSAVEIALLDCKAKLHNLPLYQLFNKKALPRLKLYGSGGDAINIQAMSQEFNALERLGITTFKVRARTHQVEKAKWCMLQGKKRGIEIAIDMTQNLQNPGQSIEEVTAFIGELQEETGLLPFFLEESLGLAHIQQYWKLRSKAECKIAGGEIVTTVQELGRRISSRMYDIVQPDATVIGGINAVITLGRIARQNSTQMFVHCWGGPVGMMANYHAAVACGELYGEWPIPHFPLREEMMVASCNMQDGYLKLSDAPGLGVELIPELEEKYPFQENAIYHCLVDSRVIPNGWS